MIVFVQVCECNLKLCKKLLDTHNIIELKLICKPIQKDNLDFHGKLRYTAETIKIDIMNFYKVLSTIFGVYYNK